MQDYSYSTIGLIAIVIQLFINFDAMFRTNRSKFHKAAGNYRALMLSIFAYYITDALWGILAGLNWIPALFIDTTLYYVAMSSAIVSYYSYIVKYLEMKDWRARLFNYFGLAFFILENIFLIINFFYPCFFWFDENDVYVAGPVRYIALWIQIFMFAFSAIVTFIEALKSKEAERKRHLAIFFFGLVMLIAILFQEHFPLLPLYAVGCLFGSIILHVYVVEDEFDDYRKMLISEKIKLEDYSDQLLNYKKAILSDALISFEANLSKDELYYGVWKDDEGNVIPLKNIVGMDTPCSYDKYVEVANSNYVININNQDFTSNNEREALLEAFNKGLTELTSDYETKTLSGRNAWLRRNICMIKNKAGDVIAYTSVKDITNFVEQSKMEELYIKALTTEYDSIAVVKLNEDKTEDKVILHSRITAEMASLIDEKTINEENYSKKLEYMTRFIHPEDQKKFSQNMMRENVMRSFAENRTHIVDFRIMKPDNTYLYYQLRLIPFRDEAGNPTKSIACMRNIDTEIRKEFGVRQELENAKIAAEVANQAKSTFLFNMSHDIRTPMNAILGFTNIAQKNIDDKQRLIDALRKVELSGNHLLSLVNDVLDMSRVESNMVKIEEEPIFLDTAKDNLYSILNGSAEEKNLLLSFIIDSSVSHHWFYGDRLQMMRILTNIVSNSVKYTNPGGMIKLLISELPCQKEGYVHYRYTVSDTGIGMSKEYLSHIFEPFSRAESATKSGISGTGLGMSIAKSLVELMDGTIHIESEPGVGTTVILDFENRISEPIAPAPVANENFTVNLDGKKILLVEDNLLNREIATELLEDIGIIVDVAEDGDIAVEKVRNSKEGQYDLILMDVQMPRMNGYDATRAIRSLPNPYAANIPIIAMTANAFDEDKKNAYSSGMNAHISKPVDVKKLMYTLTEILQ